MPRRFGPQGFYKDRWGRAQSPSGFIVLRSHRDPLPPRAMTTSWQHPPDATTAAHAATRSSSAASLDRTMGTTSCLDKVVTEAGAAAEVAEWPAAPYGEDDSVSWYQEFANLWMASWPQAAWHFPGADGAEGAEGAEAAWLVNYRGYNGINGWTAWPGPSFEGIMAGGIGAADYSRRRRDAASRLGRAGRSHGKVPRHIDFASRFERGATQEEEITTIMIRNVPNRYDRVMLMMEIDELGFRGTYDFLYLPIDSSTMWNVGYAFVNFDDPQYAQLCMHTMQGYVFAGACGGRPRVAHVSVAHVQGLKRNLAHCVSTSLLSAAPAWSRPWVRQQQEEAVRVATGVAVDGGVCEANTQRSAAVVEGAIASPCEPTTDSPASVDAPTSACAAEVAGELYVAGREEKTPEAEPSAPSSPGCSARTAAAAAQFPHDDASVAWQLRKGSGLSSASCFRGLVLGAKHALSIGGAKDATATFVAQVPASPTGSPIEGTDEGSHPEQGVKVPETQTSPKSGDALDDQEIELLSVTKMSLAMSAMGGAHPPSQGLRDLQLSFMCPEGVSPQAASHTEGACEFSPHTFPLSRRRGKLSRDSLAQGSDSCGSCSLGASGEAVEGTFVDEASLRGVVAAGDNSAARHPQDGQGGEVTTLTVWNVPKNYTLQRFLMELAPFEYDFVQLPRHLPSVSIAADGQYEPPQLIGCAHVNFCSAAEATRARQLFESYRWSQFSIETEATPAHVTTSAIQGYEDNVTNLAVTRSANAVDSFVWYAPTAGLALPPGLESPVQASAGAMVC